MSGDTPQTHVTHSTTLSSLSSSPVTVIIVTISVRRELPGELDLLEVSHVLPGEGEEPEDPAGHLGDGEGPRDVAGSLEQEGEGEETHVGQALDQDLSLTINLLIQSMLDVRIEELLCHHSYVIDNQLPAGAFR